MEGDQRDLNTLLIWVCATLFAIPEMWDNTDFFIDVNAAVLRLCESFDAALIHHRTVHRLTMKKGVLQVC